MHRHNALVLLHLLLHQGNHLLLALMCTLEHCRLCNQDIVHRVQQVICFAFHDSRLLLQTCSEAKEQRKIVTLFYLD